jgi:hypothetical protein
MESPLPTCDVNVKPDLHPRKSLEMRINLMFLCQNSEVKQTGLLNLNEML